MKVLCLGWILLLLALGTRAAPATSALQHRYQAYLDALESSSNGLAGQESLNAQIRPSLRSPWQLGEYASTQGDACPHDLKGVVSAASGFVAKLIDDCSYKTPGNIFRSMADLIKKCGRNPEGDKVTIRRFHFWADMIDGFVKAGIQLGTVKIPPCKPKPPSATRGEAISAVLQALLQTERLQ